MKKLLYALTFIGMLASCGNSSSSSETKDAAKSESETLRMEVMGLHDEVMPHMGELHKLGGQLMAASTGREDSAVVMQTAADLKEAKDAMMTWMRNFSSNYKEDMPEEEKVEFLKAEKEKMQVIKIKTEDALERGRGFMEQQAEAETASDNE